MCCRPQGSACVPEASLAWPGARALLRGVMDGYSLFGGSVFGGFGDKDDGSGAPKPAQPAADAPLKSGRAWSPAAGAASAPAGASAKATGRPSSPVFSSEATDSAATDESAAPAPTQAAAPTAAPSAELTADEVQRLQQQVAQLQAEKAQLAALAAQNNRPAGLVDPVKPDVSCLSPRHPPRRPRRLTPPCPAHPQLHSFLPLSSADRHCPRPQAVVDGAAPPDAWQRRQQAAGVASASSMSAQAGGAAQPGSPPPQSSSSAAVVAATGPATEPAAAGGTGAPDKRTGPPTRWPANETGDDDAPPQLRSGPDDTFRLDRPRGARMTEKWQKRWSSNGW
eukprot:SAG25_NODE_2428_length_1618_cov_1.834760_1_plen_337_part_10